MTTPSTPAERQQRLRDRRKALGLKQILIWVRPEVEARVRAYAAAESEKATKPEKQPAGR